MNTKELQIKLLAYYRENLAVLPEDFLSARRHCFMKYLEHGVSYAAHRVFEPGIFLSKAMASILDPLEPEQNPVRCRTTDEIKQALQLRIDILEKIVAENT